MNDADATRESNAAREWAALRGRIRTITPQALARAGLTVAVTAGIAAATTSTWPALMPFAVGGLIAYALLPLVDALNRVMPRPAAAALSMAGVVVGLIAVLALVVPPLAAGFVRFALELPAGSEVRDAVLSFDDRLGIPPDASATVVIPVVEALARVVKDAFAGMSGGLDEVVRSVAQGVLTATATVIGLIVLPAWMLGLMTEKHRLRNAIDARLPATFRDDVWAVLAIADRAAGRYLRGYVVVAALVATFAYVGAALSPRLGGPAFGQPLALAAFAGLTQLIPILGPLLGLVPGVLLLVIDPSRAAAYVAVYVTARILGANVVGSRVQGGRLGVHPGILVPSVIAIGQLGPGWLLLSAPIVAFASDLVRYVHGRLSEPARPAGALPGTPAREVKQAAGPRRIPAAYRRPIAPRPAAPQTSRTPTA